MSKSIDIISDDVRETRGDVKLILSWLQRQDTRITVLETNYSRDKSIKTYVYTGLRHLTSVVTGGVILYIITTFLIN